MTTFIRLLDADKKQESLLEQIQRYRDGRLSNLIYQCNVDVFRSLPTSPLPYWAPSALLEANTRFEMFEPRYGSVRVGAQTNDDFRFVRCIWEVLVTEGKWYWHLKSDTASAYYDEINTVVNWENNAGELKEFIIKSLDGGHWSKRIFNSDIFFKPGISWALRTTKFSPSCVPEGCIPTGTRYLALSDVYHPLVLLALWNSSATDALCKLRAERHVFIVGVIKCLPTPALTASQQDTLKNFAHQCWAYKRNLASFDETSMAFGLPKLVSGMSAKELDDASKRFANAQAEIDAIGCLVYGFDLSTIYELLTSSESIDDDDHIDEDELVEEVNISANDDWALLSWAIGVSFGRFDWRLATGERPAPPEPDPFDPLPAKSPGMLPNGANPFHTHAGILVDDQGHPHDLAHLVEEVLGRVNMPVPDDVRRWLQRDFFSFHLQRYSKSRRKAPIYWPLATASGSYTLWLYYPSLSSQTLYTAINDFVEPKLKQVGAGGTALRNKGSARSRDEEKQFETLHAFELELTELRDTLLKIAQGYQPNHDDGVQITAAPLWPLFRHKPWQKVLKDTWAKLEKGDYDWAHLAMSYWPTRVREKCKTDKSLAIAHDLEVLYVEPEAKLKKLRGKKIAQSDNE